MNNYFDLYEVLGSASLVFSSILIVKAGYLVIARGTSVSYVAIYKENYDSAKVNYYRFALWAEILFLECFNERYVASKIPGNVNNDVMNQVVKPTQLNIIKLLKWISIAVASLYLLVNDFDFGNDTHEFIVGVMLEGVIGSSISTFIYAILLLLMLFFQPKEAVIAYRKERIHRWRSSRSIA
ncbi:hypothetical protein [Amphritea balenae]|uniref:Uncharacterized protein n=1 Tax=Amphritea balenae TaxID=452629 RepID=A0A3P1SMK7_9GAMM|nr:hypothetical protein [Amphritea balenae]RRC98260.1 hypothetical protein EHS89_14305 [Amphritea balenae]GGK80464.1 hypothetical protein GCM10007941_33530 [Amphritea balenae]